MSYDARQSRPFTPDELRQFDAAAEREWQEKWAPAFDAAVEDGGLETGTEKDQTRAALKSASDELVDMTVQTPWERKREEVDGNA